jgi:hypothetical protein
MKTHIAPARLATFSLLAFVAALTALSVLFKDFISTSAGDSPFGPTSILRPTPPNHRG